ncbi:hypothetical protein IQ07DRAFT_653072 [Pyrenochaeta sp. DS3sAY3a]|nr:hypothetical protein IQ07DRAFT_653072 [Pyrenochaeta sp. DS3sAY3a]
MGAGMRKAGSRPLSAVGKRNDGMAGYRRPVVWERAVSLSDAEGKGDSDARASSCRAAGARGRQTQDPRPTTASTARRIARAGLSTLPTPTATRRGQRQQAIRCCLWVLALLGSLRAQKQPAVGCGYRSLCCPWLGPARGCIQHGAGEDCEGCPNVRSVAAASKHGLGCSANWGPRSPADDCPGPCRLVFPPAGSTRPPGGARRHSVLSAVGGGGQDSGCCNSAAQPGCQRAAGEPAGASCTPSVDNARWLREPLQAHVVVSTVGWPRPAQGLGMLPVPVLVPVPVPTAVAPDARNDAGAECSSAPTWRSTPLGKLYDGGAPGQA